MGRCVKGTARFGRSHDYPRTRMSVQPPVFARTDCCGASCCVLRASVHGIGARWSRSLDVQVARGILVSGCSNRFCFLRSETKVERDSVETNNCLPVPNTITHCLSLSTLAFGCTYTSLLRTFTMLRAVEAPQPLTRPQSYEVCYY